MTTRSRWPTDTVQCWSKATGISGDQLRCPGHRSTPALVLAREFRLRPHALPAAVGAGDGRAGPGGAVAVMGIVVGVCQSARCPGSPAGPAGQAGIRAGAPAHGGFPQAKLLMAVTEPSQAAHHRPTVLRAPFPHIGEELLFQDLQPTLRAEFHPGHHQLALRRVDRGLRVGTAHRRAAGPLHPPHAHPGNER